MKKYKQVLLTVCLASAFIFLTACGSKEDVKNTTNASKATSGVETRGSETLDGMSPDTGKSDLKETERTKESTGMIEGVVDDLQRGAEDTVDRVQEGMTRAMDRVEENAR